MILIKRIKMLDSICFWPSYYQSKLADQHRITNHNLNFLSLIFKTETLYLPPLSHICHSPDFILLVCTRWKMINILIWWRMMKGYSWKESLKVNVVGWRIGERKSGWWVWWDWKLEDWSGDGLKGGLRDIGRKFGCDAKFSFTQGQAQDKMKGRN